MKLGLQKFVVLAQLYHAPPLKSMKTNILGKVNCQALFPTQNDRLYLLAPKSVFSLSWPIQHKNTCESTIL